MAYKQPRVPPMKEGAGLAEYIRELVLFLKDFSLETWMAVRNVQNVKPPEGISQEAAREMLDAQAAALRKEMAAQAQQTAQDIEEAKAAATKEAIDSALPVGIVVKFANESDPNALYPWQTWTQITDGRVEIAANSTYPLGSTGGAETVKLTTSQMPSHTHKLTVVNPDGTDGSRSTSQVQYGYNGEGNTFYTNDNAVSATGEGTAHDNMQPYVARNFWQRTA